MTDADPIPLEASGYGPRPSRLNKLGEALRQSIAAVAR